MSILFGLLMFLVAAMVCAVIIAASLTSVKTVRDDFDNEQAFLTVESAEKLLEKDISGGTLTRLKSTTTYFKKAESATTWTEDTSRVKDPTWNTVASGLNDFCRSYIIDLALPAIQAAEEDVALPTADSVKTVSINVSYDKDGETESLCPVIATMSMDPETLELKIMFTQDESRKSRANPTIIATFKCDRKDEETPLSQVDNNVTSVSKEVITVHKVDYTWSLSEVTNINR